MTSPGCGPIHCSVTSQDSTNKSSGKTTSAGFLTVLIVKLTKKLAWVREVFEKSPKIKHRLETKFILNTAGTGTTLLAVLMLLSLVAQQAGEEGRAAGSHQGTAEGED